MLKTHNFGYFCYHDNQTRQNRVQFCRYLNNSKKKKLRNLESITNGDELITTNWYKQNHFLLFLCFPLRNRDPNPNKFCDATLRTGLILIPLP